MKRLVLGIVVVLITACASQSSKVECERNLTPINASGSSAKAAP